MVLHYGDGETLDVPAGKTVMIEKGERFRPMFPEGNTEYIPVCLPAFRPDRWWWAIVRLIWGLSVHRLQVVLPTPQHYLFCTSLMIIVFTLFQYEAMPFNFADANPRIST